MVFGFVIFISQNFLIGIFFSVNTCSKILTSALLFCFTFFFLYIWLNILFVNDDLSRI